MAEEGKLSAAAAYLLSLQNQNMMEKLQQIETGLGWICFLLIVLIFCTCIGWLRRR